MKSRTIYFLLFITMFLMAILPSPGLAHLAPEPGEPDEDLTPPHPTSQQSATSPSPLVNLPGPPPLTGAGCWASLKGIKGCIWQILDFAYSGSVSQIGGDCCQAFVAIPEDCWTKMFPFQPSFGPLVRDNCKAIGKH
ncbi:hypothetical protein CRG98_045950 [Punica granatum]|uniref:Prolamin-like domain-containing protein n=1 Tax=Punica granatum TaxID=22663 RepID=A0A2I0HQV0_PUNGR|nr:hypothetical protein CRG98_045950 [Punica granatum]